MDCSTARTKDPDEWIELAPYFSRRMAAELRELIFRTAPDLTESIKWNMICFTGRKLVCGLSACKKHLGLAIFRGTELPDPTGLFSNGEGNTNIRSVRITALAGLDRRALAALLLAAAELDARPDVPPAPKIKREPWPIPDFFAAALRRNRAAAVFYQNLAPTYQREYLVWLTTAKRPETRDQRLQQTLAALAAGKKWIDRKLGVPRNA
jgi:hypothetical protein